MTIILSVVTGPDDISRAWGDVVMGLSRRLEYGADQDGDPDPFGIAITFYAPNRHYTPDWVGVRLGSLSTRYGVLGAQVALPPVLSDDPVGTVVNFVEEVVEAACARAQKRKISGDLPAALHALSRIRNEGPAPVRAEDVSSDLSHAAGEVDEDYFLRVTTSTGEDDVDPSEGYLESLIDDLLDGSEDVLQLDRIGTDSGGVLRITRIGSTVRLERTENGISGRLEARTSDPELLAEVVYAWAFERRRLPADLAWRSLEDKA